MTVKVDAIAKRFLPKDPFFRLLVVNSLAGIGISGLMVGGIFYSNIGNLTVLIRGDDSPLVPILMLVAGLVITLVSVVVGSAIMLLGADQTKGGPGSKLPSLFEPRLEPIPVKADTVRVRRLGVR
ncbi:hypothetical protein AB1P65_08555 [Roseibium alexandrii]